MGKTAGNAVWLDPNKTSPYDFFQYWRNQLFLGTIQVAAGQLCILGNFLKRHKGQHVHALDDGCNMQFGGDDQWSNMLGGTELIRRKLGKDAYAMTITLLTDSQGKKMGTLHTRQFPQAA